MKRTVDQVIKRHETLKSERATLESHLSEIAQYILPRKDDINQTRTPGDKRNVFLYDSTGMVSNELLAGALHSLLTNPAGYFFELTTGDFDLDNQDNVRIWLQDAVAIIHNTLNQSNFQTEVHEVYLDLGAFGTAVMSVEEDDRSIIRFSTKHIRDVVIAESSRGMVNELGICYKWTPENIVEEFGKESLSKLPKVKTALEKNTNEKFDIIHQIYPSEVGQFFNYHSQYVAVADKVEVMLKGFREFPYLVPRWIKAAGETWGRSCGMNALPEVKMVNKMMETTIKGAQKVVDPPMQAPDDGFIRNINLKPGGISYYRAGTEDRIIPLLNDARIDFGFEMISKIQQKIEGCYYVDQLKLKDGPQMTATEVMQRTEESMRLLGPMLGRQQAEFLKPLVERIFNIMYRRGLLPEIPEVLQDRELNIQYSSLIARTQRMTEGQNILRTMEAATPFINADQTVLDNLNGDEAFKTIARIYGFPQRAINDKKVVEGIRQGRAEAQQKQQQMLAEQAQADNMSKMAPLMNQQGGATKIRN
jgi:hypothetical protein